MFRRLIMTIFRLYMKYLLSSYAKHTWAVYIGEGGGNLVTAWNPHVTHTVQHF